jgi:tetratricopeptide (TPR) repeat protein
MRPRHTLASTTRFTALLVAGLFCRQAAASSSADELVLQARQHEAAHEEDVAVRRYTEALTIEPTNADAWLGLGALRMKLGEPSEAERVYATALDRVPRLHAALVGRARARWALGRHAEAEADLDQVATADGDVALLRELAGWFADDGRTPAQLAVWRQLLWLAVANAAASAAPAQNPDPLVAEARRMVRALVILVDGADPASSPVEPDTTRRILARIAKHGG